MHHDKSAIPKHEAAWLARTKAMFLEVCGVDLVPCREAAIAALPTVEWKGRTLYTLRCRGDFGKGPHLVHVAEPVLWSMIALDHFTCPYHR